MLEVVKIIAERKWRGQRTDAIGRITNDRYRARRAEGEE